MAFDPPDGALPGAYHRPSPPPGFFGAGRSSDGTYGLDLFECFVDSPHANADNGLGYAGYILMSRNRRGGALGWRAVLPPMGFDSTAAAELHATTMALKHTVAIRTLQFELELGVGPTVPTVLLTDAQAVTGGSHMERLTGKPRWLAAKYAMIRLGVACRAILLERVASEDMVADGGGRQ